MTFGGCSKLGKIAPHTAAVEVSSCVILRKLGSAGYLRTQDRGRIKAINKPLK